MTWLWTVKAWARWVLHGFPPGAHAAHWELTPDVHDLTMPRTPVAGTPPWGAWESELPELPAWAAPDGPRREGAFGMASGSMGSDYGGGWARWEPPGDDDRAWDAVAEHVTPSGAMRWTPHSDLGPLAGAVLERYEAGVRGRAFALAAL